MRRIEYVLLLFLLLTSCEHKQLCLLHNHTQTVRVAFDWSDAPDASPDGMALFFYDMEGEHDAQRFDINGMDGGVINVTSGYYTVLCYNNDTEYTQFRDMGNLDTHEAFTTDGNLDGLIRGVNSYPRPDEVANQLIMSCPDMLWGCTKERVKIEITDKEVVITLRPHEMIATYTYEVRNLYNTAKVTSFVGVLSSMSYGLNMVSETPKSEIVSIPFEGGSIGETTFTGAFYTFGVPDEDQGVDNHLTLYVWMQDGKCWYYDFSVTDQIKSASDKKHVHLIIENLSLPLSIEEGGGYKPSVDDWPGEEYDINV